MSISATPTLAVYNPDLLSDDDLCRQFVVRGALLDRLLADLRSTGAPQHHLLVGQRGMGKTMLLRRLRAAIAEDSALSARWLALPFPEEQYNVGKLSDLWANCLDALGDALEAAGAETAATDIDDLVAGLPDEPEEARSEAALAALLAWAETHTGLVLLIDNIDLVLDRLDTTDHWAIREALSTADRLAFVAASSQPVDATTDYGAPFYDFFAVHELRGLDLDEARALLLRLAEVHDAPRVTRIVQDEPARIRALHVLTGGNPRTLVLLYQVLANDDADGVHVDLERLLDQCTPLYKARFEALAAQAQQVVDALALGWDPMTAAEVARAARIDVNSVSSQLNRLVKSGTVEKVGLPGVRRTGFQVAERFFNIWYLMRASRRVRRRLAWLVRFLELFYGSAEASGRAGRLLERGDQHDAPRRAELALAWSRAVPEPALARALEGQGLDLLATEVGRGFRRRLAEMFDLEGEDREIRPLAERKAALAEARRSVLAAKLDWQGVGCTAEGFWELLGGSISISVEEKARIGAAMSTLRPEQMVELRRILTGEHGKLSKRFGQAAWEALRTSFRCGDMADLEDVAGADASALRQGEPSLMAIARIARIEGGRAGPTDIEELEQCMERCANPTTWASWGGCLRGAGRFEEAEAAWRRAIEIDSNQALPWNGLGNLLQDHLGRFEEAEAAYRRAIEVDSNQALPWNGLGNLLQYHLGRFEEAEAAYRRAIEIDSNYAYPWNGLGNLLKNHLGRFEEAEAAWRRAIELAPDAARLRNSLAWSLYLADSDLREAEEHARKAVALDPADVYFTHTLACVLARRGTWDEAAALARRFISEGDEDYHARTWDDTVLFFADAVATGHAADGAALLMESGYAERWRPLHAALAAAAAGDPDHLLTVAPEVRTPAAELLDRIWPSDARPQGVRRRAAP